ncbi:MAG: hypothetical protein HRT57_07690 [Crocinitomicaceae bacterium]|nr:hypothetical protein [Crocinitomicaceae bacterium]
MGEISIFNYEIFYLDYLEGRLSEEDIRMLMAFLKEHPECELDDPDLPVLSAVDTIVYKGKSSLKQTDDKEAITLENIEYFMISDAEGIISDEKRVELNQVVAQNPELETERKRFGAVYFTPDMTSVFENKGDLKRRKTIVLWPYVSVAAAASVIAFVFLMNGRGSNIGDIDVTGYANNQKVEVPVKLIPDNPIDKNGTVDEDSSNPPRQVQPLEKGADDNFTPLRTNRSRPIIANFRQPLKPITVLPVLTTVQFENENSEPILVQNDMRNPIQPITSFVSEKTNRNVDMGMRKKAKDKKGGFFFKVGKFEISRNKH